MGAEDLVLNGHDVVVVEYHLTDVFETQSSLSRRFYYTVLSLPRVFFDGVIEHGGGNNTTSMYEIYLPLYEQRKVILSDFSIDVQGVNSMLTDYVVQVSVEKVAENNSQNLALFLALTETDIDYEWMGQPTVNYCERLMLPDANGTQLDFSESDILDFSFSFSIGSEWIMENCELAVWIQDVSTKEVQQAVKRSLSDFGDFPERDAMVKHIYAPVTMCSDSFEPQVEVVNLGSVDLTSLDFVYQVDIEPEQTYSWNGNIPFSGSSVINLPEINLSVLDYSDFTIRVENPNGQPDEFPYNDTLSAEILEAENVSSPVTVVIKLDAYPEQTSWEVLNSAGTVLYSGGNYSDPNIFVTESLNLGDIDCYSFKIYDSNGDGLTGTGLYKLMYGTTVFQTGKEFGYKDEVQFGIGLTEINESITKSQIRIYPNPVSEILNIESNSDCDLELIDLNGNCVIHHFISGGNSTLDISNQAPGLYYLRLVGKCGVKHHKIIVKPR